MGGSCEARGEVIFPQPCCTKCKEKVYNMDMMAKIPFSDVTPPDRKRSIRNVPIPTGGKRKVPLNIVPPKESGPIIETPSYGEQNLKTTTEPTNKEGGAYEYYYPKRTSIDRVNGEDFTSNKKSKKKFVFGGIALVVVLVFIVGMMTVFASATIELVPKSQDISVDTKITASSKAEDDVLIYEVTKLTKNQTTSVPAAGEEMAEVKASGKIIVYNNFSTEPQRLIVRTRFESPEGLIYRIPESIIVPGKTSSGPGSIEVVVYADEAGDKYNIDKTDFTIPGFKSDANRYKGFYARSSTDMSGGFVGKRKTVLQTDKDVALQDVEAQAKADLLNGLKSKVPDGLVLLPGAIIYESKELPIQENGSSVVIGKEVTAYAIMFNAETLGSKIADQYISKSDEWADIKPSIKDFSLLNLTAPSTVKNGEKVELQINGTAKVLAHIDTDVIKERVLGAPKGDAGKLMDEFTGISSVTATLRPVWKRSFPDNLSKIYIKVTIPK